MLKQNKLLIDKDCPMCVAYGSAFTKMELIDNETLSPYQIAEDDITENIDMKRASTEIALLDTTNQETKYGIDAMIHIVSHDKKWFNRILKFPLMYFPLKGLYKFISYNRKIITGESFDNEAQRKCEPDIHYGYQAAYILLGLLITCLTLLGMANYFETSISWGQMLIINVQLALILFALTLPYGLNKALQSLGNWQTINIIGALLALPIILLNSYIEINHGFAFFYLFGVVLFMFGLMVNRLKRLSITRLIALAWLAYVIYMPFFLIN